MLIPGDNEVCCGLYGTFEDAIIRFISDKMEVGMTKAEMKLFVSKLP